MGETKVNSYRDLIAWRQAMDLVSKTYAATRDLTKNERFGLTAQMRRCAVSIASNIAEGWGRDSTRDDLRFLHMARGSVFELCTQAEVARRLGYPGNWAALVSAAEEIGRILNGLITALAKKC